MFLVIWEVAFWNGDGLRALRGSRGGTKAGYSIPEMGAQSEERSQQDVCYRDGRRLGDWFEMGGESQELKLAHCCLDCLLLRQAWLAEAQGMPAGLE